METLSALEVQLLPVATRLLSLIITGLSLSNLLSGDYPQEIPVVDGQCFDVIIVGAGSAGCVVANRLSEVEGVRILLIEAGKDPEIDVVIPGFFPLLSYSKQEWKYFAQDNGKIAQLHKEKKIHYAIGKQLGGSSGTNFMFYARGHPQDFDKWVEAGATGWDWETALYYYRKSERLTSQVILNSSSANLHYDKGYLGVSRFDWGQKSAKYLEAFKENGHRILLDNNDLNPLGYSQPCFTIDPPLRQNVALAFLNPIKDRKNLFLLKNTFVRKVLFDENKKAVGVEVKVHGKNILRLCANKEVILSAGTLNSPRILMSSGVGPKVHLEEKGVPVLLDSPNVGQNMQDHPFILVTLTADKSSFSAIDYLDIVTNLDKLPTPTIMGFASLNKSNINAYPDYQVIGFPLPATTISPALICSYIFNLEDYICEAIAHAGQRKETFFALHSLLHPESRGSVKLKSNNPEDAPIIDSGFYKTEADLEKHAGCVEDYVSVINTTFFRRSGSKIVDYGIKQCRNFTFASHEYWKCHILNIVETEYHPTATCAMGPEGVGVTDERLRVRGLKSIRVVDGAALPLITSGNTNAPVIMLAERASDLIKEDNGWPVETVQF